MSNLGAIATLCGLCLGGLCLAGCSGYAGPRSIVNDDPAVKIPQIKSAVDRRDKSAVPTLLSDLDSDDSAVRFYAIEALRRMSGETFGYDWTEADRAKRRPAIARWQAYFDGPTTRPDGGRS